MCQLRGSARLIGPLADPAQRPMAALAAETWAQPDTTIQPTAPRQVSYLHHRNPQRDDPVISGNACRLGIDESKRRVSANLGLIGQSALPSDFG